jgi:hypothetical protein
MSMREKLARAVDPHAFNDPTPDSYAEARRHKAFQRLDALLAELREPDEAMWGGLARQMMLWLGFERATPRTLFTHLQSSGYEIPQWLRDEPEMQALDHVPSKGTRCVLIFRAMLDSISQPSPAQEDNHA